MTKNYFRKKIFFFQDFHFYFLKKFLQFFLEKNFGKKIGKKTKK